MPRPLSATSISRWESTCVKRDRNAAVLGSELHGVGEEVPEHLLQAVGIARRGPAIGSSMTCNGYPSPAQPAVPFRGSRRLTDARSERCTSRRTLPEMMLLMSSRSWMICACERALRSMTSSAFVASSRGPAACASPGSNRGSRTAACAIRGSGWPEIHLWSGWLVRLHCAPRVPRPRCHEWSAEPVPLRRAADEPGIADRGPAGRIEPGR